jgi:hypothetical protein
MQKLLGDALLQAADHAPGALLPTTFIDRVQVEP